jgi:hypothetical protein
LGKELVPDETAAKKKKAQKAALVDLSPFANHLTASENAVSKYRYHPSASSVKAPVLPALSISPIVLPGGCPSHPRAIPPAA